MISNMLHSNLFIDFDDTLIEKQSHPIHFRQPDDLRDLCECLSRQPKNARPRVTLVTGRHPDQIDRHMSPARLPVVGCHGALWRLDPDQPPHPQHPPLPAALRKQITSFAIKHAMGPVEDKDFSIALHGTADAWDRAFDDLINTTQEFQAHYTWTRYDSCAEIKSKDTSKGQALMALTHSQRQDSSINIYIGNDVGEDPSLDLLCQNGWVLCSVGSPQQRYPHHFATPRDVRSFLRHYLKAHTAH